MARRGVSIAYTVVAIVLGLMMFISASGKLMRIPGAVHAIHGVVGVPLNLFPLLAACLIAGGLGLIVGIFRPRIGRAAAGALVLYFVGAIASHLIARDWAGLKAPIVPFLLACTALILRVRSMPRA